MVHEPPASESPGWGLKMQITGAPSDLVVRNSGTEAQKPHSQLWGDSCAHQTLRTAICPWIKGQSQAVCGETGGRGRQVPRTKMALPVPSSFLVPIFTAHLRAHQHVDTSGEWESQNLSSGSAPWPVIPPGRHQRAQEHLQSQACPPPSKSGSPLRLSRDLRLVPYLTDSQKDAGPHEVKWQSSDSLQQIYF